MRSGDGSLTSTYTGFYFDLLEELSSRIGFNFTIEPPPDNKYGALNETTGEATGMIAELLNCVSICSFMVCLTDSLRQCLILCRQRVRQPIPNYFPTRVDVLVWRLCCLYEPLLSGWLIGTNG